MTDPLPTHPAQLLLHTAWLRRLARGLVRDVDLAEEVVQDTLVAALEGGPRGEREEGLRAWLSSVARNFARRRRRGAAVRRYHEERAAANRGARGSTPELAWLRTQQVLTNAVMELDEPHRTAIVLRFQEGASYRALARRFGISEDAVRKRVSRGVALLRARVRAELGDEADGPDRRGGDAWCLALLAFASRPRGWVASTVTLGGITMGTKTAGIVSVGVFALVVALGVTRPWEEPGEPRQTPRRDLGLAAPAVPRTAVPTPAEPSRAAPTTGTPAPAALGSLPAVPEDHWLRGRVLDPGGEPRQGAEVELWRDALRGFRTLDLEADPRGEKLDSARTNAAGEFAFELAPGAPCDLVASDGELGRVLEPNVYAGEFVELTLNASARLAGRIERADGSGVAGARLRGLRLHAEGTHTDGTRIPVLEGLSAADGTFDFGGLAPGSLWLEVLPVRERALLRTGITLEVGRTTELRLRVEEGRGVRGRVLEAATGRPVAGAEVGQGWGFARSVRTDAEGAYELSGLETDPLDSLCVRARGYAPALRSLDASPGDPGSMDFELYTALSASGRLVDGEGDPIAGAYLGCLSEDTLWTSARSGADGRFRLTELQPERAHGLLVVAAGFGSEVFEFPRPLRHEGTYELGDLRLEPGGLLRGLLLDATGAALARATLHLEVTYERRFQLSGALTAGTGEEFLATRAGRTDARGRFCFADLAPGLYTVAAGLAGQGSVSSEAVRIHPGETVDGVRLVLDAGWSFRGQVVDEQGEPLAGVGVAIYPEPPTEGRLANLLTDGTGRFAAEGFALGTYRLEAFPTSLGGDGSERELASVTLEGVEPSAGDLRIVLRSKHP